MQLTLNCLILVSLMNSLSKKRVKGTSVAERESRMFSVKLKALQYEKNPDNNSARKMNAAI